MYALNSSSPHFDERPLVIITNMGIYIYIDTKTNICKRFDAGQQDRTFISLQKFPFPTPGQPSEAKRLQRPSINDHYKNQVIIYYFLTPYHLVTINPLKTFSIRLVSYSNNLESPFKISHDTNKVILLEIYDPAFLHNNCKVIHLHSLGISNKILTLSSTNVIQAVFLKLAR